MKRFAIVVACLTAFAAVAAAHHSFEAEYDASRIISISGKVVDITLQNPHSVINIDVTGVDGKVTRWRVALDGPVRANTFALKSKDQVIFTGYAAKDKGPRLRMSKVVRPADGWAWDMATTLSKR